MRKIPETFSTVLSIQGMCEDILEKTVVCPGRQPWSPWFLNDSTPYTAKYPSVAVPINPPPDCEQMTFFFKVSLAHKCDSDIKMVHEKILAQVKIGISASLTFLSRVEWSFAVRNWIKIYGALNLKEITFSIENSVSPAKMGKGTCVLCLIVVQASRANPAWKDYRICHFD